MAICRVTKESMRTKSRISMNPKNAPCLTTGTASNGEFCKSTNVLVKSCCSSEATEKWVAGREETGVVFRKAHSGLAMVAGRIEVGGTENMAAFSM